MENTLIEASDIDPPVEISLNDDAIRIIKAFKNYVTLIGKLLSNRNKTDNKEAIFGFMQSCSCLSCRTWHHVHVVHTSSACHLRMHVCCPHQDTSSAHCLQAICTTPHGHRGPELSFTVTGICY